MADRTGLLMSTDSAGTGLQKTLDGYSMYILAVWLLILYTDPLSWQIDHFMFLYKKTFIEINQMTHQSLQESEASSS